MIKSGVENNSENQLTNPFLFFKKVLIAVIISAGFLLVPLIYLLTQTSSHFSNQLKNLEQERKGVQTIKKVTNWTNQQTDKKISFFEYRLTAFDDLDVKEYYELINSLDELDKHYSSSGNKLKNNEMYLKYIEHLAMNSKLVLDTELETYYLMLIITEDFPQLMLQQTLGLEHHFKTDDINKSLVLLDNIKNKLQLSFSAFKKSKYTEHNKLKSDYENIFKSLNKIEGFLNGNSIIEEPIIENIKFYSKTYEELQNVLDLMLNDRYVSESNTYQTILRSTFGLIVLAIFSIVAVFVFVWNRHIILINTINGQNKSLEMASKLSTLGELAGSIGHEIATPLSVISSSSSRIQRKINQLEVSDELNKDFQSSFEKIERMVKRIDQIIKSIKNQVHTSDSELPRPVSVKDVVTEAIVLTQSKAVKNSVEIKNEIQKDEFIVMAIEPELVQVLTNLISNAIDASSESFFQSKNFQDVMNASNLNEIKLHRPWVKVQCHLIPETNEISIVVSDSGKGVPKEIQNKIFDSLFTTKKSGNGTGLGLSISKRLIQKQGGSLSLLPNNPGAQFEVKLKKSA